ncbi:NrfD/PsrC family molybdoenzyme membrane anchor subunit [Halomarina halobia]|uniref:NrfD/PsrC family molybdoenzyme membrane anchor subunit n=1 Tax=Halomarina halobia TaxID=3033386 RepID=A0ABD6ADK4_9EURY
MSARGESISRSLSLARQRGCITITNYGFVIDNRKCIGCHACTVACKAEHDDPIGVNKTWVKYIEKGEFPNTNRNFSVMRCNHCDDSPCTDVCPVTALWEREDGIVDFDPERCIGCKACMQGCPYDALYIDPNTDTAAKCNYCSHRVDSGREPACVTVCPEDAIIAGDMDNPDTEITQTIADQEVQARKPEKGTEPKLFYVDGDEASVTPGTTAREEHYMWSDAPNQLEVQGGAREDFDLQRAAESLADSDVSLPDASTDAEADADARTDGGCGCGGECGCGGNCRCGSGGQSQDSSNSGRFASDGGYSTQAASGQPAEKKSKTEHAYELLHEEARRVYDIGESHYCSWGWEVYSYTWTKAIAAGALLIPALLTLVGVIEPNAALIGIGAAVSLLFLGVTTVLLILDLEQPRRFHWVLLRPNWNSWLVKGGYILTAYGGFLTLLLAAWLAGLDTLVTNPVVLALGAIGATATAVYTAFLFSQSKGRDLWQSPAMPLHMVTQAVIAGGAVTAAFGLLAFDGLVSPARWVLAAGLLTHLALVGSEIFTPHQTEDAEEAAARIVRGRFRVPFWAGGVAVGIALPLVALAVSGSALVVTAAGALALAGLFAFEYCWITAPQTISLA